MSAAGKDHVRELVALGCDPKRVFLDDLSEVAQPQLERAIESVRQGDHLVVLMLRKGVQSGELTAINARLKAKGAFLEAAGLYIDTATPAGEQQLDLIVAVLAEAREARSERIRQGVASAREAKGAHGRTPTAMQRSDEVMALHTEGVGASEIAARTGVSRASVYRIIGQSSAKPDT